MIEWQVISYVMDKKDVSIFDSITEDLFTVHTDEFCFIKSHYDKYGNIPDDTTFFNSFENDPDFDIVTETKDYLVSELRKADRARRFRPVIEQFNSIMTTTRDYDAGVAFLTEEAEKIFKDVSEKINSVDVEEDLPNRVTKSESAFSDVFGNFISTGFDEIDRDIVGFQRGNEFVVIFARINQGKSWVLEKMCEGAVEFGNRVGYFSPEMSVTDIGYRFDTLHSNIPNLAISLGRYNQDFSVDDYKEYAENFSVAGKMFITKPKDFARRVTVSKLRQWAKQDSLDMIAIDGITYLSDERFKRGDSKAISLTNISEDLMDLSDELKIPIIVVVQSNRGGIVDKNSLDTPDLENIKDSDGIAANASQVYSVRQLRIDKENDENDKVILIIERKKARKGKVGQSYKYEWDINLGKFISVDTVELEVSNKGSKKSSSSKQEAKGGRKKVQREEDAF